jgi:hypothetical protein
MNDKPASFKLQNGLSASMAGFEDASVARVAHACRSLNFVRYPSCRQEWLVLTVQIGSEKIHLLYQLSGVDARRTYTLILKQRLMHKYWKILRDASFIVYNDALYAVNEATFTAFEYAIKNKVSPKIAILITPQLMPLSI